jgi:hypothetical protein
MQPNWKQSRCCPEVVFHFLFETGNSYKKEGSFYARKLQMTKTPQQNIQELHGTI